MTLAVLLDMRATTLTRVFQPYRLGRADMRGRWSLARASFPASQRAEAHLQPFASRILQAQANGGSRAALRAIRRASTRTEYRNQRFTRLAAHRTIGLNGPDVCCRAITLLAFVTLFAFVPWGTLRSLWTLCSSRTLRAGDALDALRTLWTCGTLGPRITLWTGVPSASGKQER